MSAVRSHGEILMILALHMKVAAEDGHYKPIFYIGTDYQESLTELIVIFNPKLARLLSLLILGSGAQFCLKGNVPWRYSDVPQAQTSCAFLVLTPIHADTLYKYSINVN